MTRQTLPREHIIWLQTSFLGDIVLSTGALQLSKKHLAKKSVTLVTTPLGAKALANEDYIDHIVVFNKREMSSLKAMLKVKNDLLNLGMNSSNATVLVPHRSTRSSLLSRIIGFPRIGYKESSLSFLFTEKVARVAVLHECARIGLLMEPFGIERSTLYQLKPTLAEYNYSPHLPKEKRLIGIAPGSKWGTKMWPIESFCDLSKRLSEDPKNHLVFLGSPEEAHLGKKLASALRPDTFTNLIGQTNLDELRGIYPKLNLMLSNDSSPLHYASAFNIPTVAIFGATVPGMGFGPRSAQFTISENTGLDCRPCSDHGPQKCPLGHFRCMRDLGVDQVLQALQSTY